ncbi:hypothetical protein COY16_01650 [Candidatus Roizmanbacteria bacterium CG_4_10_14_0_2_um_filter_39_13]|uniref:DUF6036 domain-containing protein n=1 Tax=Candidatus Roizmanbacteria bacterium CG_4_10_14_0_2_um_filter_39_13 TaxID=1974825 RepID=A0A2M7U0C5_9BACT|nr:MAG: hypothetical protein COY16_01650 [Candidatus Roizmanbacteria bacterium CG_4_10_14_0_2_um_filter_39_13]
MIEHASGLLQGAVIDTARIKSTSYLDRLIQDYHPIMTSSGPNYIIEGGVAVALHYPNFRSEPNDIDIIAFDKKIVQSMRNAHNDWCDVHDPRQWFGDRNIPFTVAGLIYLQQSFTRIDLLNVKDTVYILNPRVLAASKLFQFRGMEMRPKDLFDLMNLNIGRQDIEDAMVALQGK